MMMRRRRAGVGLPGTMAVGGLAYAAGNSAAKSGAAEQAQDQHIAELEAQVARQHQAPPAPQRPDATPAVSMDDKIAQLQELAGLMNSGVLTQEEFAAQKARILST
jgi:hypothetical protein